MWPFSCMSMFLFGILAIFRAGRKTIRPKDKTNLRIVSNYTQVLSFLEAPSGFEPENRGFAVPCLTTWLWRRNILLWVPAKLFLVSPEHGAGNEIRTRYLHLGKVALCQMSYARRWCLRPESNWRHTDFQSVALPTELPRHILLPPPKGLLVGTTGLEPVTPCL